MAARCVFPFLSSFSRTAVGTAAFRHFSRSAACRSASQTDSPGQRSGSPWTLMAAVCLQRPAVISAELSPIEQRFKEMMEQMELEKSVLSDHELRLLEDADRLSRKQADDYDSDEEDGHGDQEIMLAQDLEDAWEQKLKTFQPAPRVRAEVDEDLSSAGRCLDASLVLLARQQLGSQTLWLLPQAPWRGGETLRQTAQRALDSLPGGLKASFLGNAPCGVFKSKLGKAARTERQVGTKVFFFRAVLAEAPPPTASLLWLKSSELETHLRPPYLQKVQRFVLAL